MTELFYKEHLIDSLEEIGRIDAKIAELDELKERKDELRAQIQKWLEVNNLEEYETIDNTNQIWKIKKGITVRKSISDWAILESILGDENKYLIEEKESSTFTVKKLKKFSDSYLIK